MKKILYLIAAVGITWAIVSCDNEPKNPGDFSIASELSLGDVVSEIDGKVYQLKVALSKDSLFGSNVTVYDTIWDENGEYVERSARDVYVPKKFTTRYVEYEPIMVSAYPDTFNIAITSNAKWSAPTPTKPRGGSQFYSITEGGGGTTIMRFRSELNENATRTVSAQLNIYSEDSTVYHKVMLLQEGLR